MAGTMTANTKNVDLLVIGSGPAALGFLIGAVKQQKFGELLQDDGIAVLDQGVSLGGGMLSRYGINSNTSANSFLKCIFRKGKDNHSKTQMANLVQQTAITATNNQVSVGKFNIANSSLANNS